MLGTTDVGVVSGIHSMPDRERIHVLVQHGCARCGADKHLDLDYLPFTQPVVYEGEEIASHYCLCPINGEPILMRKRDAEQAV